MAISIGDKVTLPHNPTLWERIKALFGYNIPEEDTFIVQAVETSHDGVFIVDELPINGWGKLVFDNRQQKP